QLDGGRFATSDLNDLYRRVINRNNRLKKLQSLSAPDIIIRNEKRMLQEAVDSLFDNSKRKQRVLKGAANRPLKSISDMLKGKQGRFRQNLLGKRVDYSGRSVIVVGPELKLWQCGLPEKMALELFKPFIMKKLVDKGVVFNIKKARSLVESESTEVFAILDEVVREHPVMLNRAPTLHRLGIQAFEPVLVPGKALKLHPLACKAFNADFDGDQMAIHVPLTQAAQMECWTLMLSARNLLDPANGNTIVAPSQDMVLGIYYMTSIKPNAKGTGKFFSSADEVRLAASSGAIEWQAEIKVHKNILNKCVNNDKEPDSKYILTSAGRMAFNESMPDEVDFYNEQLGDKKLKKMIESVYHNEQTSDKRIKSLIEEKYQFETFDAETLDKVIEDASLRKQIDKIYNRETPLEDYKLRKILPSLYAIDRGWLTIQMLDAIKACGYKNATFYGATLSMDDILVPEEKEAMVAEANKEVEKIVGQWNSGAITADERYNKSVTVWENTNEKLTNLMMDNLAKHKDGFNTIYMMATSGARGSKKQISQLAAMRGLMQKPNGDIIELPIRANFKEGLSVIEFFISTNGARKGLSDTALKTADAGYMTRRLVDVAQDVVVNEEDCGTINGIDYAAIKDGDTVTVPLAKRIAGHYTIERVIDPVSGELLCDVNQYIDESLAEKIDKAGVEKVKLRTVLTCESKHGICVKCYGKDLARNKIVEIGEAVGTIAAQSIGQPGTQLTLRTFHTGGAA
ncbi:MAG: DNA-directed RNA polymerase subunit beta', partial [Treponema sp.]|nr:DNA-directed RNA polymerase subunit beta' [Treponema sp.]